MPTFSQIKGAGDRNFERMVEQRIKPAEESHPVVNCFKKFGLTPSSILEVGASSGYVLEKLRLLSGAKCTGIDISEHAISEGKKVFPQLELQAVNCEEYEYGTNKYDLIVFAGCLFQFEPASILQVFASADKALKDEGQLFIWDFLSIGPLRRPYRHESDTYIHKFYYPEYFNSSPFYNLEHYQAFGLNENIDNAHYCCVYRKSKRNSFFEIKDDRSLTPWNHKVN